jgi:hypothetical protein
VRAFTDDPPAAVDLEHSTGTGTGTDYLRARARAAGAERDAARVIHEPLSAVARAGTLKRASLQGEVLCAAYLLDRDAVVRFGEQVAELQRATPELRLVCTGPWPPYSFAEQ